MSGRHRGAGWFLHLLTLLLLAGCVTTPTGGSRLNLWPLLVYQQEPATAAAHLELIGPLVSWDRQEEQTTLTVAPLFYWQKQGAADLAAEFLYPLGQYRRQGRAGRSNFIPLGGGRWEAEGASSGHFFPFFWGRTAAGAAYGGVFPVYGTFRERFGRERLTFVLWPLFTTSTGADSQHFRILWPLFSWSVGQEEAAVFWPLFGYLKRAGEYEKYYALWPLLHYQRLELDRENPRTIRMFLPFYVAEQSDSSRRLSWLFPFFSYYTQAQGNYRQVDCPWPFYVRGEGEGFSFRQYFPWYYRRSRLIAPDRQEDSLRLLWYLYARELETGPDTWRQDYRVLLFSRLIQEIDSQGDWRERWRLWPLAAGTGSATGSTWRALALLPLESEGWERLYAPYLELLTWRRSAAGSRGRALWGLWRWERGPDFSLWELGFLASGQTSPQGSCYRLLSGLVTWERQGRQRQLKLLYLPWGWRWQGH